MTGMSEQNGSSKTSTYNLVTNEKFFYVIRTNKMHTFYIVLI